MRIPLYMDILEKTLFLSVKDVFPDSHRFMADNDPKHNSKIAKKFLEDNGIYWWRTPAESYREFVAQVERVYKKRSEAKVEGGTGGGDKGILGDNNCGEV